MLPDGYSIRPLAPGDAEAMAAAYRRNRAHLEPWEPVRPEEFYTSAGQALEIARQLEVQELGLFRRYVIHGPDRDVVGRANIQNIVGGSMQGGSLGYWVDAGHLRRGLATAAVDHVADQALEMGLHRLEAATMVENLPSQRVLTACGFEQCGLAPQLLFLNGAWRDHVLYQRVLHNRPLAVRG